MTPSDEELLAQYKSGDGRAFRALVERYAAPIYNLAFRFLREPMEAENVTQETFLRVIGAIERVRLDIPFKPYLFQIAVNLCRDIARKQHPLLFSELSGLAQSNDNEADATGEMLVDDAPALWENLAEQELRAQLHAAIDRLPTIYQTVVILRYIEDMSYEEIARTCALPLNTVRTHLRRAKNQLRLELEKAAGVSEQEDAQWTPSI